MGTDSGVKPRARLNMAGLRLGVWYINRDTQNTHDMYAFTRHTEYDTHTSAVHVGYPPIVILLGLGGMIFSLVGNIIEKQEMYPLFLQRERRTHTGGLQAITDVIPASLFFSCVSDILVGVYGLLIGDPIVVIYGVVNTLVIVCTVGELYTEHMWLHNTGTV